MEYIGIDVHKRDSQVCILGESGEVVLEQRVRTQRERLGELLSKRPKARVLLEASTESEWVARYLEERGHEVVVKGTNFAPMYATRSRRVKTDKRDARSLAEACRLGAYRPAHRISDARRHLKAQLAVRDGWGWLLLKAKQGEVPDSGAASQKAEWGPCGGRGLEPRGRGGQLTGVMRAVRRAGGDAVRPMGHTPAQVAPQGEAAGAWASLAA
ncbi:transposase [Archangium violaceum]|uniref:IS110 family transposase n=1 Tax=Archangium violaceum TaxID=83451 RepID=UPI00193B62CD|nr:transposase [Archangium violaceum]QRK11771.1 transposase [Archangium violaceum]